MINLDKGGMYVLSNWPVAQLVGDELGLKKFSIILKDLQTSSWLPPCIGCPKKTKSPNFVLQLTPLVFIG